MNHNYKEATSTVLLTVPLIKSGVTVIPNKYSIDGSNPCPTLAWAPHPLRMTWLSGHLQHTVIYTHSLTVPAIYNCYVRVIYRRQLAYSFAYFMYTFLLNLGPACTLGWQWRHPICLR